jgi:lysophospholipase L1-like esterase
MQRFTSIVQLVAINLGILLLLLITVELIFGDWFAQDPLRQLNLIRNQRIQVKLNDFYPHPTGSITYTRDQYGLRGTAYNEPHRIDVLTVGGSTTDQRYIDDTLTWQYLLQQRFARNGHPLIFSNAGVDAHSTFAHLKSVELWFPHIPNLKPRYVLLYVGINDFCIEAGHPRDALQHNSLWQRSAVYQIMRTVYGHFRAKQFNLTHAKIDLTKLPYTTEGLIRDTTQYAMLSQRYRSNYAQRLTLLIQKIKQMGATPVCITQPMGYYMVDASGRVKGIANELYYDVPVNGVDYYYLQQAMDETLRTTAMQQQVPFIDAARLTRWEQADFYDYVHLTPQGTKKLAEVLYEPLNNVLK